MCFFHFFIFWVVIGIKCKKWPKITKNFCLSHFISQEPYIIWLSFVVHKFKMIISAGCCFIFSKFYVSWSIMRKKGKKWPKLCLLHSMSHELYVIWLWFLGHMCKNDISVSVFFLLLLFFKFLISWVISRLKCKKWCKMTKNSVCCSSYLRNHTSMFVIYGTLV